ncbi:MAG: hypothetical protein KJO98_07310, partial [Rhodothermia bacterium]|nr:hypothetical protein [Rhodothermia bacterium]
IRCVRDWFLETVGGDSDYPKVIWSAFNDFSTDLFERRLGEGIDEDDVLEDITRMPVREYLACVSLWLDDRDRSERPRGDSNAGPAGP